MNCSCGECGKSYPEESMIQIHGNWVCAQCKSAYVQKLKEGVAVSGNLRYAGFWIRVGAKLIDQLIMGVSGLVIGMGTAMLFVLLLGSSETARLVVLGLNYIVGIALGLGYTVFFLGRYGATPGKMACRLTVVMSDGSSLTYGRAALRFLGEMVSGCTLGIGYLMVAFDKEERRGLHDRICDTRVIIQ